MEEKLGKTRAHELIVYKYHQIVRSEFKIIHPVLKKKITILDVSSLNESLIRVIEKLEQGG
ncbi:MAG: hypothetical protein ACP5E3_15210 [Bacteroidales bacterium]